MNLAQNLVDSATARGGHVAIKLDDSTLTYTQLDALSQRAAGLLQEYGVQPGDRVGLMLPNVPHFAVLYYAALRLGAVVVPMNPLLKEREVAYYLSDSGARVILVWNDFAEEAGQRPVGFTADAREFLVAEAWPDNVRELQERVRQAVRIAGNGAVSAEALMLAAESSDVPSFKEAKRAF